MAHENNERFRRLKPKHIKRLSPFTVLYYKFNPTPLSYNYQGSSQYSESPFVMMCICTHIRVQYLVVSYCVVLLFFSFHGLPLFFLASYPFCRQKQVIEFLKMISRGIAIPSERLKVDELSTLLL